MSRFVAIMQFVWSQHVDIRIFRHETFRERIQLRCTSLLRVHRDSSFSANDVSAQSSELDGSWCRDVINIARKRDSAKPSSRNVLSLQCIELTRRGRKGLSEILSLRSYLSLSMHSQFYFIGERDLNVVQRSALKTHWNRPSKTEEIMKYSLI